MWLGEISPNGIVPGVFATTGTTGTTDFLATTGELMIATSAEVASIRSPSKSSLSSGIVIIGSAIGGGVVLIAIGIVLVLLVKRRKKTGNSNCACTIFLFQRID